jgi:hypothetical protein
MFSLLSKLYTLLLNAALKHVDKVVIRMKQGESGKSKQKYLHNILIIIGNKERREPAEKIRIYETYFIILKNSRIQIK